MSTLLLLAVLGPQGFLDSLQLRSIVALCNADGTEKRGDLVWVGLETLVMDGERIRRREPLAEKGQIPKVSPSFEMWIIEPTAGHAPLRVMFGVRELR